MMSNLASPFPSISREEKYPQHMGYFSSLEMEGKGDAKLLIISCYRPCRGSTKGGEGTIWKQQWSRAQHLGLGEDYDPRQEMLISLANFLSAYPTHELIIGGDFNDIAEGDPSSEGSPSSMPLQSPPMISSWVGYADKKFAREINISCLGS